MILKLRGVVSRVLVQRMARLTAGIALDETDKPVVVGVSPQGAVVRLRVTGSTDDDFKVESELFRLDRPQAQCSVVEDITQGNFPGGITYIREWLFDLGEGRKLRLGTDGESSDEDRELEAALAAAAGWPADDS